MAQSGTKRRRDSRELAENSERFQVLFEAVGIGIVLIGPTGEVKECNQAALDLLGCTRDQLVGQTAFDPEWKVKREDGSHFSREDCPITRAIATRKRVGGEIIGV